MKFMRTIASAVVAAGLAFSAHAAGEAAHAHGPEGGFPFEGPLGKFEMDSVQRGYQVYREVCAACHSMKLLHYRNLGEPGGPFYDPDYPNPNNNPLVKAFAEQDQVMSTVPDEYGEFQMRPARPSDAFRSPYPNDAAAAAANGGAVPPDFSVIVKARHGGANYIYNLIKGYPSDAAIDYRDTPDGDFQTIIDPTLVKSSGHYSGDHAEGEDHGEAGVLIQPLGQYYNPYMAGDTTPNYEGDPRHTPKGGFLAMGPQLLDGRVEYLDGTEATVQQMSYDIAQFLAWAAEPKQEARKSLGLGVMVYLFIFAVLLWFSYQRIWRNVGH